MNFNLKHGEVRILLGENGAGKSTLVEGVGGVYYPDGGTVVLNGERVDRFSPQYAMNRGWESFTRGSTRAPSQRGPEHIYRTRSPHGRSGLGP
ncbi:ATP-binding cassette domain-containing protein [Halomonas sp.]|uniref:ATP-binding cassette domain-containing protein n=1 Tax=Halomonas sp. TaxID=1486246 RepID=UPI003A0FFF1C